MPHPFDNHIYFMYFISQVIALVTQCLCSVERSFVLYLLLSNHSTFHPDCGGNKYRVIGVDIFLGRRYILLTLSVKGMQILLKPFRVDESHIEFAQLLVLGNFLNYIKKFLQLFGHQTWPNLRKYCV